VKHYKGERGGAGGVEKAIEEKVVRVSDRLMWTMWTRRKHRRETKKKKGEDTGRQMHVVSLSLNLPQSIENGV
jgi:hypothetical protein